MAPVKLSCQPQLCSGDRQVQRGAGSSGLVNINGLEAEPKPV